MLSKEGCAARQQRLRQYLAANNIDGALLSHRLEVYYFSGLLVADLPAIYPACVMVETGGDTWVVTHVEGEVPCADASYVYPWSVGYTMSPDLERQLCKAAAEPLGKAKGLKRLGYQGEYMSRQLAAAVEAVLGEVEWVAIDGALNQMQQRKDADEIELIRRSVQIDLAAYDGARAAIGPGVNELEVLAAAQKAAHLAAGEKVLHDGDYACGEMGGFARDRAIEAGELYVIDAWVHSRGYWADLCRTFAVGGAPTDLQQSIYDHIKAFHDQVHLYLQPGKDGTECFAAMDAHIRQHPALADVGLVHHAGHNVGLRAHQMPDLNADRGGTLEAGNVVSVEPGAYIPEARLGVRLENMYLIKEDGIENLSPYPFELVP